MVVTYVFLIASKLFTINEDKENALINYSKSVEINPINVNALNIIKELELVLNI